MFTAMKDRLQRFLEMEQLTPAKLADILGIQRSGLSHILSGRNKPGFDFIQKLLLKFPALSSEWLITGKGKVYKENSPAVQQIKGSNLFENVETITQTKDEDRASYNTLNKPSIDDKAPDQPIENSIKTDPPAKDEQKRALIRLLMIFSDGTFKEYIPGKD